MMPKRRFLAATAAALLGCGALAATEPRTGVSFPERYKGAKLSRLGVRTKGPIKVYAVGQYSDDTFLLKMSMGVGAEKLSNALADALKPRCSESDKIEDFEKLLLSGLPNGASKGTSMAFGTGGGKLTVSVNDKSVGSVPSKSLAKAFAGIYTDRNAVCTLHPVNADNDDNHTAGIRTFLSPKKCAAAGAAVGYGLGKLLL